MEKNIERIIDVLSKTDYRISVALKSFDEHDYELVNKILEHNKNCAKDPSCNIATFWTSILDQSHNPEPVLYAIASSPYAPDTIIKHIANTSNNTETLLEILKRDTQLDDATYDRIQKIAKKKEMCNILKDCYQKAERDPLPFNQYAIDYYAKKTFNKANIKNDKMLIMLSYAKDKDFLISCHTSPKLDETRLNYLIDNENMPEEIRNKMFTGVGFNTNDITPDYNAIKKPTPFMVNEIYSFNSESYFFTDSKTIKSRIISRILNLVYAGLTTEGIEKDIINKYVKGDKDYKYLLSSMLSGTKHITTIEYATKLDYRIFDEAFGNAKLLDEIIEKYGLLHMNKITESIKRTGHAPQGSYWWPIIVAKKELSHNHYDIMLNSENNDIYDNLAISPKTPKEVLNHLLCYCKEAENSQYSIDHIGLTANLNLKMKEKNFSDTDIFNWCSVFINSFPMAIYSKKDIQYTNDIMKQLILSNRLDDFEEIISELSKEYKDTPANSIISEFYDCKKACINSLSEGIDENLKSYTMIDLYNKRNSLLDYFQCPVTLGNIYMNIREYGDKLVKITDEINNRNDAMRHNESTR